jgi:hypothetical protein
MLHEFVEAAVQTLTLILAVSRVNGGKGGRDSLAMMLNSPDKGVAFPREDSRLYLTHGIYVTALPSLI